MEKKLIHIWITKYALTSGIFEADAEIESNIAYVSKNLNGSFLQHYLNNDWHLTEEAAKKRAQEMKIKKISSLQKQIKKIEEIKF
jgi:hypothetical protein